MELPTQINSEKSYMLQSIEGTYKDGKVEFSEVPGILKLVGMRWLGIGCVKAKPCPGKRIILISPFRKQPKTRAETCE
jgi:hypothetical protein